MNNYNYILQKLKSFIRKYYINELLKGSILFASAGLLYFLLTLFIEYTLWLKPTSRAVLFFLFLIVEAALFIKFIAIPLMHLFNLRTGIDFKTASKYIGNHFPEVEDKLVNMLQLKDNLGDSDLIIASIEQKAQALSPIPFQSAINFKANIKYLKFLAIPALVFLISYAFGKVNWISDSYQRVVDYKTAYEPPAPFEFFVLNDNLQAIENKSFKLKIATAGEVLPENVQIQFNEERYFLKSLGQGNFEYEFELPKSSLNFKLLANDVVSKSYALEVVRTPSIIELTTQLDYPNYTKKPNEVLKSTGSATVPEGTKITWIARTQATESMQIYAEDTITFNASTEAEFKARKQVFSNFNYTVTTSNNNLKDYENLSYSINVIKDAYPELFIDMKKDSINDETLYFRGKVTDDYGITRLNLVYYPEQEIDAKKVIPLPVKTTAFAEFVSVFPNQVDILPGVVYNVFFEVYDNDELHNKKRTKSRVFTYRKRTTSEDEQRQLQSQNETIKSMDKTIEKLKEQDQRLKEFSKTQIEKKQLNFNEKQRFKEFLKRQKQQENLMKNFNKNLQDNLEKFQEDQKEDPFKKDLKQRLKDNEEQLKEDEKLLEELEQLKDKINKEEFTEKLEELAKQNKNKKRSMEQLLELTKRFYVMKKTEKVSKQLDELSEKQKQLSNKEPNNPEKQRELNEDFKKIKEDLDELKQENRRLRKPMDIPRDKLTEETIEKEQQELLESIKEVKEDAEKTNAKSQKGKKAIQQKQKKTANKIKQLSKMLEQSLMAGGGGGSKMSEDIDMLRQILDNLLKFSFNQEALMRDFEDMSVNNNNYGSYIIEQNDLKSHFEHIDDSLFALSLRQPKLSEKVNKNITDVYYNIDKALGQLTENRIYQGVAAQQYVITATNELSSFLNDVLDNMEMQMNMSMGQGEGDMQLPDIIMSQEELNKKMQEALEKKDGESGEEGEKGQKGEQPKGNQKGSESQSGNQQGGKESEQQGENGSQKRQNRKTDAKGDDSKEGKNGKGEDGGQGKGNNKNEGQEGERSGYGEGGVEEQNAELFKIYKQQQLLRQALENKLSKSGKIQSAGELIKAMEEVESDLINKGFTNQTLQKMMDLQHQLLKLENATFMQGQSQKRQSNTNEKVYDESPLKDIEQAKRYFNTTEILNRQNLPLQNKLKQKVKAYFNTADD